MAKQIENTDDFRSALTSISLLAERLEQLLEGLDVVRIAACPHGLPSSPDVARVIEIAKPVLEEIDSARSEIDKFIISNRATV